MKLNVFPKVLLLLFVCFVCAVEASRCDSAPTNLDGTWEWTEIVPENSLPSATIVPFSTTLTFSGNSFSRVNINIIRGDRQMLSEVYPQLRAKGYDVVENTGRRITIRERLKGTFSLTDTEIEFVYEDGDIAVWKFSRTENTFTMDKRRYIRKQSQLSSSLRTSDGGSMSDSISVYPINPLPGGGSSDSRGASATQSGDFKEVMALFDNLMVFVQGGTFTMGCTPEQGKECDKNEKPAHQVTLSDYYIGKYEVTYAQWQKVMGNNTSTDKGDNLPVENVSWNDIQEFIKKLNEMTSGGYRLPTEAEWEYAARGGIQSQGYKHSGSNNIRDVGWYILNSLNGAIRQVGTKKANELGIHDMSGNVSEWVHDWLGDYGSNPQTNPQGPSSGKFRAFRGGNYYYAASEARVSNRNGGDPSTRYNFLGFRLARSSS